jgi:hypothetical protein
MEMGYDEWNDAFNASIWNTSKCKLFSPLHEIKKPPQNEVAFFIKC